jgi:N-acetylneuraminic acid mutarotase
MVDSMPTARTLAAGATLDGHIYVIGGKIAPADSVAANWVAAVERYNAQTDSWESMNDFPSQIASGACAVVDGSLYHIGGKMGPSAPSKAVYKYDPTLDSWEQKADMSNPRLNHAAVEWDGHLYVMGGTQGEGDTLTGKTLERYDPQTDSWVQLAGMHDSRLGHAAAVVNGKIYVTGGRVGGTFLPTAEVYDPQTDQWTRLPDMPSQKIWHGMGVVEDHLYVFGGFGTGNLTLATWQYDDSLGWHDVGQDVLEFLGASVTAVAVDGDGHTCLYALGGFKGPYVGVGTGPMVTRRVEKFTPNSTRIETDDLVARSALEGYPNPFSQAITLRYTLPKAGELRLALFNLTGQQIATIFEGFKPVGTHELYWEGEGLARGLYLCQLTGPEGVLLWKKLVKE